MSEPENLDSSFQKTLDAAVQALKNAGAHFVFLTGSRAEGRESPDSDIDVAAYFGRSVDIVREVPGLPGGVDLVALDEAPLELAGRVALRGKLLFEADPGERADWQAKVRKIYLDEMPRIERSRREFVEAMRTRGRR